MLWRVEFFRFSVVFVSYVFMNFCELLCKDGLACKIILVCVLTLNAPLIRISATVKTGLADLARLL